MIDAKALEAAAEAMLGHVMLDGDTVRNWLDTLAGDAESDAKAMLTPAITAYLAAERERGFVMVPVEPTEAMLEAGQMPFHSPPEPDIYRAMIAAAQVPTSSPSQ